MVRSNNGKRRSTVVAAAAAFAVLVAGCGGSGQAASQDKQDSPTPVADNVDLSALTKATTKNKLPDAPKDPKPHGKASGVVIHPEKTLVVRDSAGGEPIAKLPEEQLNSPTWVPVIGRKGDWAHILLPTRPNGASGWVKATKKTVESAENHYRAKVDLSEFSLTVYRKGEQTGKYEIGIGSKKHPTPTGRAYIIASVKEQVNDYSPIILPLSVHSNTLTTYGGGPGTVGIHTWPNNSFLGQRDSDGCIRVTPSALDHLVKLPLGTVVDIVK